LHLIAAADKCASDLFTRTVENASLHRLFSLKCFAVSEVVRKEKMVSRLLDNQMQISKFTHLPVDEDNVYVSWWHEILSTFYALISTEK
jgi:hypothetical protein